MDKALLHPRRRLDVEGAYNIRDLGGYPTMDGRRTRWGRFLRADGLHALPEQSQDALIDYGVRTVVDLRLTREVEQRPNVFASRTEVNYRRENVLGDHYLEAAFPDVGEPARRLVGIYTMVLDERQPALRRVLGLLAGSGASSAMYNCTAGKDRTGVVSALLLGLARVPHETIAEGLRPIRPVPPGPLLRPAGNGGDAVGASPGGDHLADLPGRVLPAERDAPRPAAPRRPIRRPGELRPRDRRHHGPR